MADLPADEILFRNVAQAYVAGPRFVRRDWLAIEVQQQLDRQECRFVLLTGEPGSGKSSFIAQLSQDNPSWPVFFTRRDQRTGMGETSARSFLLRVGLQLAALWPELFDLEQIRIDVTQVVGSTEQSSEMVGVRVERIRASPFHQTVVRISQQVQQAGGSLTGLSVGEWIADPRLIELDDLQEMALLRPARSLARLAPQERIVILVDALDELMFGDHEGNLLDWLANGPPLPANVRMVLSSRPTQHRLDVLIARRAEALYRVPLAAEDVRVRADVTSYAALLVRPPAIAAALRETGRSADAFIAELAERADGNIGYTAALGRAFDNALAGPERRMLLEQLLRLDRLPDDIGGLFAFFLRLIQNGPGRSSIKVTDPATGRIALLEGWSELYQPILALLSVGLQPLTLDQVHGLGNSLASRGQVAQAISWLEQFLDRAGDGYRLYHVTFAEFLTSAETRNDPVTTDLWVDAGGEHRRLANAMVGEGWPETTWQDSPEPREQGRRAYARFHYVTHLFLAEEFDTLARVIEEGGYGRGKLRFDPSTFLYARDLDLAIRAARRWEADDMARPRQLLRLWRFKLLRATFSSYAERLPSAAYAGLALVGRGREAVDLAGLITDPRRTALALAGLVRGQVDRPADAARLFRAACEAAARVDNTNRRSRLLGELLAAGPPANDVVARDAAIALARSFSDPTELVAALSSVALWLHVAGRGPDALAIRDEILTLAEAATDEQQAIEAVYTCAMLNVNLGDLAAARDGAAFLHPADRAVVLMQVVLHAQAEIAVEVATTLRDELAAAVDSTLPAPDRARLQIILADVSAALGDASGTAALLNEALATLLTDDPLRDASLVRDLANIAQRAGLPTLFDAAVQGLQNAAMTQLAGTHPHREASFSFTMSLELIDAALVLTELRAWEPALEIARGLQNYERGDVLLAVVTHLVSAKAFDRALAVAHEISAALGRGAFVSVSLSLRGGNAEHDAFVAIASGLADEGRWEPALDVARKLENIESQIEAVSAVAIRQHGAGLGARAAVLMTEVMTEARLGDVASGRDLGLAAAGKLCVLAQDWNHACGIADEIGTPSLRGSLELQVVKALAQEGKLDVASQLCRGIKVPGIRAEGLLAIIRKLDAIGGAPGLPVGNQGIVALLAAAQAEAVREPDKVASARVLRAIALAHSELHTGAQHDMDAAMQAAVQALNDAPFFGLVPTPWCDTASTFAKLGDWEWAMRIANGLVAHNVYDGCCALRDLAVVATRNGDVDRASALLAQARANAPRIQIPPMREQFLDSVAGESARIDRTEEMPLSSERPEARMAVALALLESGRVEAAVETMDGLAPASLDSNPIRLVNAFLEAGQIDPAKRVAELVRDPSNRAERLVSIASALVAAGKSNEARAMIDAAGAPMQRWPLAKETARVLAAAGDLAAHDRLLTECWAEASSPRQLLDLISLAEPLLTRAPDAGMQIHDAIRSLEAIVAD